MSKTISIFLQRAADADNQTGPERAAALNGASRLASEQGIAITTWPEPPSGYQWQGQPGAGGHLVRVGVPWWRGSPDVPVQPAEAIVTDAPPPADKSVRPTSLTPALERLVALVGRPDGITVSELEGKLGLRPASVKVMVSRVRQAGYSVTFDRQGRRYHMANSTKGMAPIAHPAGMADVVR